MIFTNNLDPILFSMGPLEVRWYGFFFALGIALNFLVMMWIFKREKLKPTDLESVALYLFVGLVVGARLGHALFYDATYYFENPLEIFKIWKGGLASHGAAIGLITAYYIWTKIHKVKFHKYADLLVIPIGLTTIFIRLGNFFNSEIIGKPTNGDWGVIFKKLGEDFPRHPSQLYESFMGFIILIVMILAYLKLYKKSKPYFMLSLFGILYFGGRFVVEFWKKRHVLPDDFPLSMGQILSILPVVLSVIYFVFIAPRMKKN